VRFILKLIVPAMLAVLPVTAQDRPDFSGEWVRVEPQPDSAAVLTVDLDGEFLNVKNVSSVGPRSWRRPSSGGMGELSIGHVGHTPITGAYGSSTTTPTWRGRELVIATTRWFTKGAGAGEPRIVDAAQEEVWSIDREGRLQVTITNQNAGAVATTTRFVYAQR
jgi:hypothetical protein